MRLKVFSERRGDRPRVFGSEEHAGLDGAYVDVVEDRPDLSGM